MTFRSFFEWTLAHGPRLRKRKSFMTKRWLRRTRRSSKQVNTALSLLLLPLLTVVKVKYMRRSRKRKPPMSAKSMLVTSTLSTHWVPRCHRRNSTWMYFQNSGSTQVHSQQPHAECYPTPHRNNLQCSCLSCPPRGY